MRRHGATFILMAGILATAGFLGGMRQGDGVVAGSGALRELGSGVASRDEAGRGPADTLSKGSAAVEATAQAVAVSGVLSDDETVLLAETCGLQLLADGAELELSGEQWSALAAVTLNIQAIRQAYEAQIASGVVVAPGRYRVEIPAYPRAGDTMRKEFHVALRAAIGDEPAGRVIAGIGARLEGYFGGFGMSQQTLEIATTPRGGHTDYEVTRTVTYWSGVDGAERVMTRRETHLPAWEDPAGERWGALLAMVGA